MSEHRDLSKYLAEYITDQISFGWKTIQGKPVIYNPKTPNGIDVWHGVHLKFIDNGSLIKIALYDRENGLVVKNIADSLERNLSADKNSAETNLNFDRNRFDNVISYVKLRREDEITLEVGLRHKDNLEGRLRNEQRLADAVYRAAVLPLFQAIIPIR